MARHTPGSKGLLAALAVAASLLACRTAPRGAANPANTCVIQGSVRSPAEIRIYESDPYGSPAGKRIYVGLLNFRERQRIQTRDGRFWYAFRGGSGSAWLEGYEATCRDGQTVELP